jgi:5'(3')-deoxyribonucleotidase
MTTKKKKIVAVDMDDTLVYLMKAIQKDHNEKFPLNPLKYEDMAAFKHEVFASGYDIDTYLRTESTYTDLELIDEHVIPEMKKLCEMYDVIIVTSAFPEAVTGKWKWMQKYLPFIPSRNFITASRKDLIQADILIDDAIHNVHDWVATGRPVVVPIHHWNEELAIVEGVTPIYGWHGVSDIVFNILGE